MTKKTNRGLPSGVIAVADRPGLYRIRIAMHGKRHSEYYSTSETGKKKLQSELQKAVDAFRERMRGACCKVVILPIKAHLHRLLSGL